MTSAPLRNGPSKRERELAETVRRTAEDLTRASNYAETYVARVELNNAIRALNNWVCAGRPLR